jgi:glycosyltransferase involved in cell wall biosynthesis
MKANMADEGKAIPIDAVTHFLPVRNGIQYFPFILDDIAQNFRAGDEILIVDDNSSDTTYVFVQNYFLDFSTSFTISNTS